MRRSLATKVKEVKTCPLYPVPLSHCYLNSDIPFKSSGLFFFKKFIRILNPAPSNICVLLKIKILCFFSAKIFSNKYVLGVFAVVHCHFIDSLENYINSKFETHTPERS